MSPNQTVIRPVPSADGYTTQKIVLELYPDGSYGPHEYSTEPQVWDPSRPHLPWIPRSPAALEGIRRVQGLEVLWRPSRPEDYTRVKPGVEFYRMSDALTRELQLALVPVHELGESITRDHRPENRDIRNACDLARHCLIHIRYADGNTLRALGDLVRGLKRQILECLGHLLYREYSRRAPILDPGFEDIARPARDVVGVFTYDLEVARRHVRWRVPVWRISQVASLSPNMKIAARVPITTKSYPSSEKKLVAYVYDGEPYLSKLFVANPSQGLYLPVGDKGEYMFCGSVNTTGQIVSRAGKEMGYERSDNARAGPSRAAGGPIRTYPGTLSHVIEDTQLIDWLL